MPHAHPTSRTLLTGLAGLIALELAWFSWWGLAFALHRAGLPTLPLIEVSPEDFDLADPVMVAAGYAVILLLAISLAGVLMRRFMAIVPFGLASLLHFVLWVTLIYKSRFSGTVGYAVIVAEIIVIIGLLSLRARGQLR